MNYDQYINTIIQPPKVKFSGYAPVAMEREQKGKEERKRKKKEKENKRISFDVFGYRKERKEENVRVLSFPCLFAKGRERERENACFYLFARINYVKIHILDHL